MTSHHLSPDSQADSYEIEPHWLIHACGTGALTATLTGSEQPITVTAPDYTSLRMQIQNVIFRALM